MKFTEMLFEDTINYNLDNDLPLTECVFRRESDRFYEYFNLLRENREKYSNKLNEFDNELLNTDLGLKDLYEGTEVPLDLPFIAEEDKSNVKLNSPKRNSGSGKKYYVYVKNDKGNVIKVRFGDEKGGLTAKINNPEARASFVARHNCSQKKDKTTPGYWSCRLPYYASNLGLSGGGKFFW